MTVAYPTSFEPVHIANGISALILAGSEGAASRAQRTLANGGIHRNRSAPLARGQASLDEMAQVGLLWVELETLDDSSEALLHRISGDAEAGRYSAVIAADPELIDPLSALIPGTAPEIVIGQSDVERAVALSLATRASASGGVRDSGSDESAARLRQLSEEVSRIANTLARLSGDTATTARQGIPDAAVTGDLPPVPAELVRAIIRARRTRAKYLPADLFADPAWDMLLDLLQAEIVQHRVPVSSLCLAAAVPATTALRWIKSMTERGLLTRRPDPHDARRVFMEMTPSTSLALRRFFAEVGPSLV